MPADRLGPYRIERKLGEGGMGAVFLGRHEQSNQQVAVKLLPQALAGQEGFRIRFEGEIETLRKLNHPHIVQLIGFGEDHGQLFYVMEYVAGRSVHDEQKAGRRFAWREVVDIGLQLCKALKHAHDRGIIHRDIKPANIMLADDGRTAKLTDFGIAKLYGMAGLTMGGGPIGTANYMAPEQTDGGTTNERSDLYALGGTLFAMLAGRPPFVADSLLQMLKMQKYNDAPLVRQFAADVPVELELVIANLLRKKPAERMANAVMLARSLQGVLDAVNLRENPPAPPSDADDAAVRLSSSSSNVMLDDDTLAPDMPGTLDQAVAAYERQQAAQVPEPPSTAKLPLADASTAPVPGARAGTDSGVTPGAASSAIAGVDSTAPVPAELDPASTAPIPTPPVQDTTVHLSGQPAAPQDETLVSDIGRSDVTLASALGGGLEPDGTLPATPSNLQRHADTGDTYELNLDEHQEEDSAELSAPALPGRGRRDPNNETIRGGTVFITAEEAAEIDRQRVEEEERRRPRVIPVRTILFMTLLVVGIPALILLLRPDNADQLYDKIVALQATGPDATSADRERADTLIREFRRRFSSDARAAELEELADQLDMLEMQVPPPVQRLYREAEQLIKTAPEEALRRFESIVTLFNDPMLDLTAKERRFLERARRQKDDLRRIVNQIALEEGGILSARLAKARLRAEKNPAVARQICQSIIQLYGQRLWATQFVAQAQELLAQLPPPTADEQAAVEEEAALVAPPAAAPAP